MDGTRIPKKKKQTRKYSVNDETIEVLGVAPSLISKTQASAAPIQSQPLWAGKKHHYQNGGKNGRQQQSRGSGRHFPANKGGNRRQTFPPTTNGPPNGARFPNHSGPNGWQRNGNNRPSHFGKHARTDASSSSTHSYSHHKSQLPQHINNSHINPNGPNSHKNSYNSNPHRNAQNSRGALPPFRNHSNSTVPGFKPSKKSSQNGTTFDPSRGRRREENEMVPLGGRLTDKHRRKREQNINPDLKNSFSRVGKSGRILKGKSVITPVTNYSIKSKGTVDEQEDLLQEAIMNNDDLNLGDDESNDPIRPLEKRITALNEIDSDDDQNDTSGTERVIASPGEKADVSQEDQKEGAHAEEEKKYDDSTPIHAEENTCNSDRLFSDGSDDDERNNEVIVIDSSDDESSPRPADDNEQDDTYHEEAENVAKELHDISRQGQEASLFSSDSESEEDEVQVVDVVQPTQQISEEPTKQSMENDSNSPIFYSESDDDDDNDNGNASDDQPICRFNSTRSRPIHDSASDDESDSSDEELLVNLRKKNSSSTTPDRRRNKRRQWQMIAKSNKDTTNVKDTIDSAIVNSSNESPEASFIYWTKLDENARKFLDCEGIKNVLLENAEQLGKRYKNWRDRNGFDCLNYSHTLLVSRWQAVAREAQIRAKVTDVTPEIKVPGKTSARRKRKYSDPDELGCMLDVPFLTKTIEGGNGTPIKFITVKNFKDDTLYDFRIDIRKSTIPNSGNGAFLTFLGARVLKARIRDNLKRLKKNRIVVSVPTTNHLEANIDDVTNAVVTIRGENIHGNGNSPYFPITRFPLKAKLPGGEKIQVRLGPTLIHEDIDQLQQNREIPTPENAIGYLGVLSESDFESKDSTRFCSHNGCGLIDLGRYGPFSKEDRKTELEFNFKEFAYDVEPTSWSYGVSEELKNSPQVIDITDDRTGEPHTEAKENIPMYINEVGHDSSLEKNVLSREKDDRVVHYYAYIKYPMKKGDVVELLVCYGEHYEGTRVRKGYGKANTRDGVKSDSDESARMRRNIAHRDSIEDTIASMTLDEIKNILHFIRSKMLKAIVSGTDWFLSKVGTLQDPYLKRFLAHCQPPCRQWIARLRLSWMRVLFQQRLKTIDSSKLSSNEMRDIQKTLELMEWTVNNRDIETFKTIESTLKYGNGSSVCARILLELFEENLFWASRNYALIHVLDHGLWCSAARKLTQAISSEIVKHQKLLSIAKNYEFLQRTIFSLARKAAGDIREAYNNLSSNTKTQEAIDILGFYKSKTTGVAQQLRHGESMLDASRLYGGELSSSQNYIAYEDALSLKAGGVMTLVPKLALNKICLVVQVHKMKGNRRQHADINLDWYLLWQLVRVVHIFATTCIEWPNENMYSLEQLCNEVEVEVDDAKAMLSRQMVDYDKESYKFKRVFSAN